MKMYYTSSTSSTSSTSTYEDISLIGSSREVGCNATNGTVFVYHSEVSSNSPTLGSGLCP